MFDISALKEMKLSELQEIAKLAKTIKFNGVKKETLISQILAHQETSNAPAAAEMADDDKPKRARIVPVKKVSISKSAPVLEFDTVEETAEKNDTAIISKQNSKAQQNSKTKLDTKVQEDAPVEAVESLELKEEAIVEKKGPKIVKFNKSAYEKKVAQQKEKEAAK